MLQSQLIGAILVEVLDRVILLIRSHGNAKILKQTGAILEVGEAQVNTQTNTINTTSIRENTL